MTRKATSSAHTPGPWSLHEPAYRGENSEDYHGFYVVYSGSASGEPASRDIAYCLITSACVYEPSRRDEKICRANARLVTAAPELLSLARTFAESCEERLAVLSDVMLTAPDDADLDDIQEQIDHWYALRKKCQSLIARAEGRRPRRDPSVGGRAAA